MTCLLKWEPGASPPFHRHPEIEQIYVIEVLFEDHDGIARGGERAGEYVWRRRRGLDERFVEVLEDAGKLVAAEGFFDWRMSFPGVRSNWEDADLHGGFDASIGNPPWDRTRLQQVEWFAARRREISLARRAADRKRTIADLEKAGDPLAQEFALADERAAAGARLAQTCGDDPLLSGGCGILTPCSSNVR